MKVKTITINIHEKKAHPHEMGHRDAGVTYIIEIDSADNPEDIVTCYRALARDHVEMELDLWIAEIKRKEAEDSARTNLHWIVDRLENRPSDEDDEEKFGKNLAILPDSEQTEWRAKLVAAKGEYLARIKRDLDRIIERVSRHGVTARDESYVDMLMQQLPEDERQEYIKRMADAEVAYELSQMQLNAMMDGEDNSQ